MNPRFDRDRGVQSRRSHDSVHSHGQQPNKITIVKSTIFLLTPCCSSNATAKPIGRHMRILPTLLVGSLMVGATILPATAATLQTGYGESLVANGLSNPTAMAFAPDGRLFVCQQGGQLRVIKNGSLLATPFVTVTVDAVGERGLLGIAFDPNFALNHYVYVYYTATSPAIHNRVSRFTANGDVAVAGSEVVLLDLNNLSGASNHNGGAMHFGTDGKLYIAVGDNATSAHSQTLANLLGKMLRINSDGTIPTDNPFYGTATGVNRSIWALGLRNPFTFAVQPGTGRIFINDVGQNTWEEINDGIAGANYGWPGCEGFCSPANPNYRDPIFRYSHASGNTSGYCIAGGAFYNPATVQFPGTNVGVYFFADYVNGWIRKLDPAQGNQVSAFATGVNEPVDLKVGADGRLYYLARGSGAVYAISYVAGQPPQITEHPQDQYEMAGQPATFRVTASGTGPLSYRWRSNGVPISGATSNSYTRLAAAGIVGVAFRCVVTNLSGAITSNPAFLHLTSNSPPVATIIAPTNGTLYTAGDTIQYAGATTDPEDGTLPASAYSWTIIFHHDTHNHPFLGPINGATNGSFVIPTQGETAANVWYRIHLAVTDSGGQAHASFVDVVPRTTEVSLTTSPQGFQLTLDGQPQTPPFSTTGVVGMSRTLGSDSPQTLNGDIYIFESWSDGGAATHDVLWPATNTTFTATYQLVPTVVIEISPEGHVHLTVRASDGKTLMVQASTNLLDWYDMGTVLIQGESAEFVDEDATQDQFRFYRATLLEPAAISVFAVQNSSIQKATGQKLPVVEPVWGLEPSAVSFRRKTSVVPGRVRPHGGPPVRSLQLTRD